MCIFWFSLNFVAFIFKEKQRCKPMLYCSQCLHCFLICCAARASFWLMCHLFAIPKWVHESLQCWKPTKYVVPTFRSVTNKKLLNLRSKKVCSKCYKYYYRQTAKWTAAIICWRRYLVKSWTIDQLWSSSQL